MGMRTFRLEDVLIPGGPAWVPASHGTKHRQHHEATGKGPKQAAAKLFNAWARAHCDKRTCIALLRVVEITKSMPEGMDPARWKPMTKRTPLFYHGKREKLSKPDWFAM